MWQDLAPAAGDAEDVRAQKLFKASIARGADLFYRRRFIISDVGKYNDKGLGNPFKRSCGSGCHNTLLMGMDLAPGYMDLGLNNLPWANARPDLPLFKVVCDTAAVPQSYLGRVIYTHDPGRALITGKCIDVGASMTQQSRGLAARAPYFMNGSAANLRELVDFYDRRFNIGYTEVRETGFGKLPERAVSKRSERQAGRAGSALCMSVVLAATVAWGAEPPGYASLLRRLPDRP